MQGTWFWAWKYVKDAQWGSTRSTLAFAPEIAYFRVSEYQELSFDYEKSFRPDIEGLPVDFIGDIFLVQIRIWEV